MIANVMNQPHTQIKTQPSHRFSHWLPSLLWITAGILLLVSIQFPYWGMVLQAPQYPGGLRMRVFVNEMTGDEDPKLDEVHEIDGLNHYIGMKSMYEAASLERSIAIPALITVVVLLAAAALMRRRWMWLITIPAVGFPIVFLADLAFWLAFYGNNLDPYAPLSSAISAFTPPILGEGIIGQFKTIAYVDTGWYLAAAAAICVLTAIVFRLIEQRKGV
jgi:hypothetical protein